MVTQTYKQSALGLVTALVVLLPLTGYAKPGTLAQSPLFLASQVKSNIFFILDDSGSMAWEHLPTNRARELYPYAPDTWVNIDPTPSETAEWRELCAAYNAMAYNPDSTYTPWYGKDDSGAIFADSPVTAAPFSAYNTSGDTMNLETTACQEGAMSSMSSADCWTNSVGFFYVKWNDANGNGVYDAMECVPPRDSIPTDGGDYFPDNVTSGGQAEIVYVKDMTAEEKQNYANWFTYYRRRDYVMKRSVSQLISDSTNRMGLATLQNNGSVATPVDDVETAAHRDELLDNLFTNYSSGGTPLRWALEEAGEYFHQTDGYSHGHMTSENSPILPELQGGSCQQNFSILMSDGYWNGGTPDRANNADGDDNTAWDGGAMADSRDDTLADVAMYYYENDLSSLDDQLRPIPGIDENEAQHMVTFTVAFGVNGSLSDDPPNRTDPFTWPNPLDSEDEDRIDDMRHAAFNSRGQFLNAKDPQGLIASLNAAVAEIESRVGSASSVSFNSSELTEDTVIYRASFNSSRWSGDLHALQLDPITGVIATMPDWSAQTELDAQTSRNILTYNGSDGVPFTWAEINDSTTPITAALDDLKSDNAGGTVTDAEAEARVEYLRGERSNEGSAGYGFRTRISRLGDIVHSSPVYVGKPAVGWPSEAPFPSASGETYEEYKNGAAGTRQPIVYIGSNDGMLHGFNAATGEEVLGYVPGILYSNATNEGLHYITDKDYLHRFYVDLDPVLSDAYIRTAPSGLPSWRTILVGGLRAGGRGIYALDVTDPAKFSESSTNPEEVVLWEFSNSDDADLGHTFSRPTIAMMNNGKWAAIMGNGYNDTGDGEAKLFIVYLEDGLDGWDSGDYVEITTGVGNTTERNGLSTPAVADLDGNGTADRIYAGDLEGNLWAFDISADTNVNWTVAYSQSTTPKPLFTTAAGQPITAKPQLSLHPEMPLTSSTEPNVMVYFGSGQYITAADKTNTDTQSLYGVWDQGDGELTRSDLVMQELDSNYVSGTVLTSNTVDYSGSDRGWYFDLPETGERVITTPLLWSGNAYFNSLIPEADPCSAGVAGILTAVDMLTGGMTEDPAFDSNNDGDVDSTDKVNLDGSRPDGPDDVSSDSGNEGRAQDFGTGVSDMKQLGSYIYTGDPDEDEPTKIPPDDSDRTGRLSWHELL